MPFLCGACSVFDRFLSKWSYFISMEVELWGEDRFWCRGQGDAASFSRPPGSLAFCPLAPWGCPHDRAGWRALAHAAFSSPWVQQSRWVFGDFLFLHSIASSQENTVAIFLLSSSSQPSTYVATLSRHRMPWWYLIKSLQNCLITVLNVRHLCNLNVRYKF